MANLENTKTWQNLIKAFAGESQARNRYTYFAVEAKKEGYEQVAAALEELAGNEKEHAKIWFKLLCGGGIPNTVENLKSAIAGENAEWSVMYKEMAAQAQDEGFNDVAFLFEKIGNIEKEHEGRLSELLAKIQGNATFDKKKKTVWICQNCGHIVDSEDAPKSCPVCGNLKEGFESRVINF
jgi:rubrerythrin